MFAQCFLSGKNISPVLFFSLKHGQRFLLILIEKHWSTKASISVFPGNAHTRISEIRTLMPHGCVFLALGQKHTTVSGQWSGNHESVIACLQEWVSFEFRTRLLHTELAWKSDLNWGFFFFFLPRMWHLSLKVSACPWFVWSSVKYRTCILRYKGSRTALGLARIFACVGYPHNPAEHMSNRFLHAGPYTLGVRMCFSHIL